MALPGSAMGAGAIFSIGAPSTWYHERFLTCRDERRLDFFAPLYDLHHSATCSCTLLDLAGGVLRYLSHPKCFGRWVQFSIRMLIECMVMLAGNAFLLLTHRQLSAESQRANAGDATASDVASHDRGIENEPRNVDNHAALAAARRARSRPRGSSVERDQSDSSDTHSTSSGPAGDVRV